MIAKVLPRPWPEAILGLIVGLPTVLVVVLVLTLGGDDGVVPGEGQELAVPPPQAASPVPTSTPSEEATPEPPTPIAASTTALRPIAEPIATATSRPRCEGGDSSSPPLGGTNPIVFARSAAVNVGESTDVLITLSSAPGGMAGYVIEIKVGDPDVAAIEHVTFPDFGLARVLPSDGPELRMAAADLLRKIEPGAENATLASLVVSGAQAGTTNIDIVVEIMSDDDGEPVTPSTRGATLTVC